MYSQSQMAWRNKHNSKVKQSLLDTENFCSWRQQTVYNHKKKSADVSQNYKDDQQKQLIYSFFTSSDQSNQQLSQDQYAQRQLNQNKQISQNQMQAQEINKLTNKTKQINFSQLSYLCDKLQSLINFNQSQVNAQLANINQKKLKHIETRQINKQNYELFQRYNQQLNREVQFSLKHVLLNPKNHKQEVSFAILNRQFQEDQVNQNEENFQLDQNCNYTKNQTLRKYVNDSRAQTQPLKQRKTFYLPEQNYDIPGSKLCSSYAQKFKIQKINKQHNNRPKIAGSNRTNKQCKSQRKYSKPKTKVGDENNLGYGQVYKQILSLYSTAKMIAMSKK